MSQPAPKDRTDKGCLIIFLVFAVFFICMFVNAFIWNPEMAIRSRVAWCPQAFREIAVGLYNHRDQNTLLVKEPYWGPMTPAMVKQIDVDPQWIIDPYNHDGPQSNWMVGPIFQIDRGSSVRIKGNPFWLYSNGSNFEIFIGRGYDGVQQITQEDARTAAQFGKYNEQAQKVLSPKLYDPTNGSFSGGDVIRVLDEEAFSSSN